MQCAQILPQCFRIANIFVLNLWPVGQMWGAHKYLTDIRSNWDSQMLYSAEDFKCVARVGCFENLIGVCKCPVCICSNISKLVEIKHLSTRVDCVSDGILYDFDYKFSHG